MPKGSQINNGNEEGSVALDEWNQRFQACLEHLHALDESCGAEQKMIANIAIMHLSEDFVHASRTVGKIIISEVLFVFVWI